MRGLTWNANTRRCGRSLFNGGVMNECGSYREREAGCLKAGYGGYVCDFSSFYGRCWKCVKCGDVVTGKRLGDD